MCERTKAAVDMLSQNKKTITKGEIVMVFRKVIEDSEKMGVRMTEIEKRMGSLEEKVEAGFIGLTSQFNELKRLLEKKEPTLFEKIMALKDHKLFWVSIIISLLILGGLLGVPTTDFKGILNIGG